MFAGQIKKLGGPDVAQDYRIIKKFKKNIAVLYFYHRYWPLIYNLC